MDEMNYEIGLAVEPADRDELVAMVAGQLRQRCESEPVVDEDGDFVLFHLGQPMWVRIHADQPAIEIFTRAVHGVRSLRDAAVEVAIVNRDNIWSRWSLHGRDIWQRVFIPAMPFAPLHVDGMLDAFFAAIGPARDDLALRLRARVA